MTDLDRSELEEKWEQLQAKGLEITASLERLVGSPAPVERLRFEREMAKLRRLEAENQAQLEQLFVELARREGT